MQIEPNVSERNVMDASTKRQRFARRHVGQVLLKVVIVLVVCSALGFLFVRKSEETGADADASQVLVHTVQRGDFVSVVTETGDLESASNDEVRCEVKSVGGAPGTTILKIVDEGTLVKKEEFLLQFDDAALQQSLTQQEIVVATDQAGVIEAQSELNKAVRALKEYKKGTFLVERETFEGELFQADVNLKSAQDSLAHTERMFRKGFVSRLQLEAEQKAVEVANKAVKVAGIKLNVLKEFTLEKMVHEFEAEIEKQKAYLTAAQYTLKLSQQRRDELVEQTSKCRCVAPRDGLVVYANDYGRQIVIEEGAQIREGQVVIRLPDPNQMQVDTKISDSKINKVRIGTPAEIVLDVDPDLQIRGELAKIEPFPHPRRWHGVPIEYGALVRVIDPPRSLRPGQRAKVHIFVGRKKDVLQTPIQSVVERDGKHYCLIKGDGEKWSVRKVDIGLNNDNFVVVKGGLNAGDQVALNPDLLWDDVAGEIPDDGDENGSSMARGVAAKGS